MSLIQESQYLSFPLSVSSEGPETSSRASHVREQIEQVLFTDPKERVFRPNFGVGVRRLVFEPNNKMLKATTLKQLNASLAEALFGEVDPKTLNIDVQSDNERLVIHISYVLAALNKRESHVFTLAGQG